MINTDVIRNNYANMMDSQLIAVAKHDGHQLTPEAFNILKQEFQKRNLNHSFIESAEETKTQIYEEKIQQIKESSEEEYTNTVWNYVIEAKENETPDKEIISGLHELGLNEEDSLQMLTSVENKLKEIIDSLDTQMLLGGASFFIGIFITLWTFASASISGGYYVVAWGAILFGAIRFFKFLAKKGKYKKILENIEHKKTAPDTIKSSFQ